ncbi:DUF928 domain-containing protein [Nostoc sphaeroides]|uniref:DUF928 domain-containing protein n=1 Tax=Nostoc sphaeroides CCNUC1 TaxID=2653204 RepID=A0A5P8W821_9NOSO|nr:DUF928 domain-containing protein [Nostoc sphaeroides]MCC5627006.1 DUF928 domain-containing protein [Nostoc sphaeroides CHAB 2801]QFS48691.1 hypothetical protein GXM_06185 [Nostoc sphaeroides CCNUC1]
MKSNSQQIKLFLVVAFSCTSLLVSLTPVLAKPIASSPSDDRPSAKTNLAQATAFNQPSLPSGPPPGGRVRGGAKRDGGDACPVPISKTDLTALVPFTEEPNSVINVWGQTTVEHPSWFFYVPYTKDLPYAVKFVLQDEGLNEIYQEAIALPDKPGVIRVSLPTTAPTLALNKQYRWFLTVNCEQRHNSTLTFVEGVIQRIELKPAAIKQLETTEPLERYAIYAQNGIWYEALTTLAQLRDQNPKDARLQAEWRNLLSSIRLDDIAAEPIVSEKP